MSHYLLNGIYTFIILNNTFRSDSFIVMGQFLLFYWFGPFWQDLNEFGRFDIPVAFSILEDRAIRAELAHLCKEVLES